MQALILRITFVALLLVALSMASFAADAAYPNQSIRMIVPFAPAGASDIVARIMQNTMAQFLGQPVVIDNRAGAAGNIGMMEAARAAADGYTVFLGNVGTLAINPSLFPSLHLKPEEDFVLISLVAEMPDILIANLRFAPNSVKELVAYVKSHPGEINFASPGSGSLNRLEMEVFCRDEGLEMQHVPYKGGAGPAVVDVLAGHVELMFTTLPSAIEQIRNGNVKALAVTTKERVSALPNVPTMAESGYPNSVSSSWQGLAVPKGTPPAIVDELYQACIHTISDPEVRQRFAGEGVLPLVSTSPAEFTAFVASETARWAQVVKDTGATAE
ncbi:MAG: tripartite tricarboxylate transporter substrate binding protein [Bradyrhizobiaceae bacterium]|nr:tripartite tricarboxylate transporter substrate binding protein [Bradyrhizobiaceae bacterium]